MFSFSFYLLVDTNKNSQEHPIACSEVTLPLKAIDEKLMLKLRKE
jgi:hypothetical protein